MEELGVLALVLIELLHVVEERLVNTDLDELLERYLIIRLVLQVDVGLFWNEQVCLGEVLLVLSQLFLEHGNVATSVFLAQVAQLCLMFVLQLSLLIAKVLLLGLDDDVKLGFLSLDLLDELFEICDLLEVLDLL